MTSGNLWKKVGEIFRFFVSSGQIRHICVWPDQTLEGTEIWMNSVDSTLTSKMRLQLQDMIREEILAVATCTSLVKPVSNCLLAFYARDGPQCVIDRTRDTAHHLPSLRSGAPLVIKTSYLGTFSTNGIHNSSNVPSSCATELLLCEQPGKTKKTSKDLGSRSQKRDSRRHDTEQTKVKSSHAQPGEVLTRDLQGAIEAGCKRSAVGRICCAILHLIEPMQTAI